MQIKLNFSEVITLADTNSIRVKDDAGGLPTSFIILGVKVGAGAYQEVLLQKAEAQAVARAIMLLVNSKGLDV